MYAYRVSIAEHNLTVFAMDGTLVKPREVDFIIIHAGERYDFLLKTKTVSDGMNSFPIWGRTLEAGTPHFVEAILHYDTAPEPDSTKYEKIFNVYSITGGESCTIDNTCETDYVAKRCTSENRCSALNCPFKNYPSTFNIDCIHVNQLQLLFPSEESELPDVQVGEEETVILNFAFGGSGSSSSINARTHVLPSSPLTILNNSSLAAIEEAEFCKTLNVSSQCNDNPHLVVNPGCVCTHVQKIPYNRSIQMVFSAVGGEKEFWKASHPIHLHGHQFHVVDIQFGEYFENGTLKGTNKSIECGGTNVCTNPSWAPGKNYSIGKSGKISSTAPRKDEFYKALNATPGSRKTQDDDDDAIDYLALGLGVGLGSGLLLSLIVNVIIFILFLCCCCIKRDKYSLGGA